MLIDLLTTTLEKSGALDFFWEKLAANEDATLGVASSARPFFVAAQFARRPQTTVVIVAGEKGADAFARSLEVHVGEENVVRFYERSDNLFALKPSNPQHVAGRMQALWTLTEKQPRIIVASARALLKKLPPSGSNFYRPLILKAGTELEEMGNEAVACLEDVALWLESRGYVNAGGLEGPGTFCVQGGTLDVFPGNSSYPLRLDFFGDMLEEILRIVPSTGQTIAYIQQFEIFPVQEALVSNRARKRAEEKLGRAATTNAALRELFAKLEGRGNFIGIDALLGYLYEESSMFDEYISKECLTVLVEPRSLFDDATHAYEEQVGKAKGSGLAVDDLFAEPAHLDFGENQRATYVSILRVGGEVDTEIPVKRTDVAGSPDKLYGKLRSLVEAGYTVVFFVPNYRARQEAKLSLVDQEISIVELLETDEKETKQLKQGIVNVVDAALPLGMIIPKAKLALVSISDTKGSGVTSTAKRVDMTEITFPYNPGDYVVHAAHGVALFKEIVRQDVGGTLRDYLLLEYAADDKLFVPVEQLDRVTRYVGPEGASPRLTRLNTSDWSRALTKARKATKKLAFDLVDVYSRRASSKGFRYSADTPWQKEMEAAFPYDETPDQIAAIADVKSDMQSSRPMDRLICGDVGFGKTEVALRAAFKATQDSKQVMVLCPTTILAQQHYTNFKDRCEPFGVRVEVLSRFRTPAQQKIILEDFSKGKVDVLVGTHRLLSRDVNPKSLGLLIIDEEQRFGVGHKEQMKNLRESIDVLTLSATPIPRTMQMSISGVRDMSLILTPPDERKSVKVVVGEWDPDLVSSAIRKELARGGQVYYVSNRVRTINDAVERVTQATPEARIGMVHGQMTKDQLERVMEDFSAGELDVLVATTIIENGIDNPHTNTLIIEDSQRLGLSQMYQLKGRVGRSNTQAYAYFMFPEHISMTEEAMARLTSLHENTELGSGMKIALRDLEIRGAGSLVGAEQSGNMSAVGFDLFAQMLAQAVNATREGDEKAQEGLPAVLSDITVNVPAHTYIPEEYIRDTDRRVLLYRKLASAETLQVVEALFEETKEHYPDMPQATKNYFAKARIKAFAHEEHINTISVVSGKVTIEPIDISSQKLKDLRKFAVRYAASTKKLSVPLRYFDETEGEGLLQGIWDFLTTDLQQE